MSAASLAFWRTKVAVRIKPSPYFFILFLRLFGSVWLRPGWATCRAMIPSPAINPVRSPSISSVCGECASACVCLHAHTFVAPASERTLHPHTPLFLCRSVRAHRICQLHQQSKCKFGMSCGNLHICREFWPGKVGARKGRSLRVHGVGAAHTHTHREGIRT